MDEQNKSSETEVISDIKNYLASFNKEIQDGTTLGSHIESSGLDDQKQSTTTCYVTQVSDGSHLEEFQYADQTENEFAGTTYYATSDGALYASSHQPAANQQISFHTLASTSDSQSTSGHSGLQQIVLAVSEANGLTFGGTKEISVAIPTSVSSQVEQVHRRKQILTTVGTEKSENNEDHPTFIAMQPGAPHESQLDEPVVTQEQNLESVVTEKPQGLQDPSPQPHAIMVVQQPNITGNEQIVPVSDTGDGSTIVTGVGEELHIDDERTLQIMANIAEQAAAKVSGDSNNPVILNAGNSYQTVTIVPSDTNPGEVSYVLIVSQAEDVTDKCDENMDMSVYDFNEGERHSEGIVTEEISPDGTKMRTIRISQRKSQIATQAHMCNYCNYTSPKRYLLSRHMKSHSEERPHKCSVCERGFKTVASLQNHVNTHTGTRPHLCKDCDACFTTSGELVRHVRYKHTHEKPHRCSECDYASVELSKLKRHMRCHTGERPYQCPHCTYASPDTYKLKRHLRIHTGEKPYECDVCQARFTQSNSLKAHKLIHSGNKPVFHCQFCPTTCGRKTDLRIHVQKLHSSDKPHKCKRCGKTFPDRYSYKLHAKSHEGEKCFKCDLCSYASINHRHLESHMLIHTDQKPFQCDECGQSFRQKQLLKRHKNLYHDPNYIPPVPKEKTHECSECGKAFRHKGNLIRHLAIHDPDASAAERAEAMRIGEPKAPGEPQDGEEDDYIYDDDLEEGKDGQQVVVFEVIQLPSANGSGINGQTLTMADGQTVTLAGGDSQGFTIIQQVGENSGDIDNISGSVCESEDGEISSPVATAEPVAVALNASPTPVPRRRGRPRKYPLLADNNPIYTHQASAKLDVIQEQDPLDKSTRHLRKKKIQETELPAEIYIPHTLVKRGRPPKNVQRSPRIVQIVAKDKNEDTSSEILSSLTVAPDPEILIKREEEMVRRRLEQKQKDMDECFGFNDNDDDSILGGMPATPNFQTFHTNSVEQTS